MALTLSIGGVSKEAYRLQGSLSIDYPLGGRGALRVTLYDGLDTVSAYRPTIGQTISLTDGATTVFSGNIIGVSDQPSGEPYFGTVTLVDAADFTELLDRVLVSETYTAGQTLRTVVDDLVTTYLAGTGITRDAGMGAGATLEQQVFDQVTMTAALNHLAQVTGWVWRVKPDKTLEFFSPGSKTAAYSLTDSNGNAIDSVRWTKTRTKYANTVTVRAGTDTKVDKTDSWTSIAAQTSFPLTYPLASTRGYITVSGVYTPIGRYGVDTMTWTYDSATNALRRSSAPTVGTVISMTYAAQFPISVTSTDAALVAADGTYAAVYDAPDLFDKTAATELAAGLLRRDKTTPKIVSLTTRAGFELPGTTITCTFANRAISGSHLITAVNIADDRPGVLKYRLTCTEGSEKPAAWQDYFAGLGGGATARQSSGGTISGSVVPVTSGRFPGEVTAQADTPAELILLHTQTAAGGASGAAVSLGIGGLTSDMGWSLVADDSNTSPTYRRLLLSSEAGRTTYGWAALLTEANDGSGAGTYWILGPAGGTLHLGDTTSGASGYGSGYRLGDIACTSVDANGDVIAAAGFTERGRSTRLGEWTAVTFAAGNFTGNGAMTWTLASGDQAVLAYTLIGKTMTVSWWLTTTTVGGTPNTDLRIAIPGGFSAARSCTAALAYTDNGTAGAGYCTVSGTNILLRKTNGGNWTASTDNSNFYGQISFEVS